SERELLAAELTRLGAEVTPSQANFLWFRSQRPAAEIFDALSQRGVLIRSFHQRGGRLAHQLRVTVGTKMQNEAFLKAVREVF
ncbi:MAG TPA: aminotransferase class I/II-fold pyridoxal phosphate-dependent enzyme, partial [Polyangiaceae bacterium]